MLLEQCVKCDGEGHLGDDFMDDCVNCSGEGLVLASQDKKVYVNAYKVTREFGGNEEGGWYWNRFECIDCVPTKNKYSDSMVEELESDYLHLNSGNIYSASGGTKIVVLVESKRCESQTTELPRYE